ncbi:T-cell immunoglobulin and mucin domain-containing protein 4-like [Malaclemys terrapin pileata]|uniref:T-cell immunoglobulin and mucin domain-containing protein 4-like n=1 Tax=Malaclemys terrapin pileata TaxID=2991368 RepID=UPI0023A8A73E|nr:T-cell immunoglobulin and mucin domain-containing protein 4-like [Malaclemys terrapin pileata]
MAHSLLLRWIVLQLCIAHGVSDTTVRAKVGQSVRLPCTYSVRETHDLHVMCWGRGICPSSKCSSEIVRTDGQKVISKQSGRYQLQGSITKGDVSLTIRNVDHEDRGTYCCRIEIPGWFNDIKRNLNLQIYRARTPPAKTITTAVPTSTTPPLITSSALPTPTAPPTTTTTALPTTFPSPTTIFQTASACTEDDDFIFFTTEHVLPTAESPTTDLISERTENVDPAFTTEGVLSTETSKDSKLQSEESVDNPAQHLQNEIPTVIISVVVTVILLFTFLLVVLLTYKRSRKYQLHMIKSSDLSGEQIPNGVEEENTLLTMQQIPDGHSVSQGTCHDPVESSI